MTKRSYDYRDYQEPSFDNIIPYTREQLDAMFEVLIFLQQKDYLKDGAIDFWHDSMYNFKHTHGESIIGQFCRFCHCNLSDRWRSS